MGFCYWTLSLCFDRHCSNFHSIAYISYATPCHISGTPNPLLPRRFSAFARYRFFFLASFTTFTIDRPPLTCSLLILVVHIYKSLTNVPRVTSQGYMNIDTRAFDRIERGTSNHVAG